MNLVRDRCAVPPGWLVYHFRTMTENLSSKSSRNTITMLDIAREAGVAVGTVSRVVNGNPTVQDDVRQRVLKTIRRLGWQPNVIARSMRTSATRTVGCLLPDLANPLFNLAVKGIEERLRTRGYSLLLASSDYDIANDVNLIELMSQRRIDGMIYAPSNETAQPVLAAVSKLAASIPTVLLERKLELPIDTVHSDQTNGVLHAAEHLIALGHRRIGLITGEPGSRPGKDRYLGYQQAFSRAGLPVDPALLRLEYLTADYAYREVSALLDLPEPPTAIISGGNMMLAGVLRALELKTRRVPDEISVIAVGDTDLAELAAPSFTVVRWDLMSMGTLAAELLLERIERKSAGEDGPRSITVRTEIVLRRSCAPPGRRRGDQR